MNNIVSLSFFAKYCWFLSRMFMRFSNDPSIASNSLLLDYSSEVSRYDPKRVGNTLAPSAPANPPMPSRAKAPLFPFGCVVYGYHLKILGNFDNCQLGSVIPSPCLSTFLHLFCKLFLNQFYFLYR